MNGLSVKVSAAAASIYDFCFVELLYDCQFSLLVGDFIVVCYLCLCCIFHRTAIYYDLIFSVSACICGSCRKSWIYQGISVYKPLCRTCKGWHRVIPCNHFVIGSYYQLFLGYGNADTTACFIVVSICCFYGCYLYGSGSYYFCSIAGNEKHAVICRYAVAYRSVSAAACCGQLKFAITVSLLRYCCNCKTCLISFLYCYFYCSCFFLNIIVF